MKDIQRRIYNKIIRLYNHITINESFTATYTIIFSDILDKIVQYKL